MLPIVRFWQWIDSHKPGNGEYYLLSDTNIAELEDIAHELNQEIKTLRSTTIEQIQELIKLAEEIDQLKENTAIVHCRDCKHACEIAGGGLACAFRPLMMHETTPMAYCSDGEREGE